MSKSNTQYYEYVYEGPVKEFDRIIANRWSSRTFAPTSKKARSNLAYQFKQEFNRTPNSMISLPGDVKRVG